MGRGQWPTTSSVKTSVARDASGFFQNAANASTLQRRPGCICVIADLLRCHGPHLERARRVIDYVSGNMRIVCRVVADHDENEAAVPRTMTILDSSSCGRAQRGGGN